MILNNVGLHIQLNRVNKDKSTDMIFPYNTASDVIMDEQGNVLTDYIPVVQDSLDAPTTANPMVALNLGEGIISDSLLEQILTPTDNV